MDGITPFQNIDNLQVEQNDGLLYNHFHLLNVNDGTGLIDDANKLYLGGDIYPFVCEGRCWPDGEQKFFPTKKLFANQACIANLKRKVYE